VHDVFEDTRVTPEEMGEHLGDRYVRLAESLTEERVAAGIEKSRQAEVAAFARKVRSAGTTTIRAEILDRIDDISDLKYLLTPPPGQELISLEQREKIAQRFAKCGYMVETISADQSNP
jgi:(p)ppGpp synthase/HD superfamily hydrolase